MFRHASYDFISRCLWTHPGFVGRSFRAPVLVKRDVDIMASSLPHLYSLAVKLM